MPRYMFHGGYSAEGAAGVLRDGGAGRERSVKALVESLGGTMESLHWALGEDDFFLVATMPDSHAAAAASIAVAATGAVRLTTSELFTAADLDDIVGRRADYRAPGS